MSTITINGKQSEFDIDDAGAQKIVLASFELLAGIFPTYEANDKIVKEAIKEITSSTGSHIDKKRIENLNTKGNEFKGVSVLNNASKTLTLSGEFEVTLGEEFDINGKKYVKASKNINLKEHLRGLGVDEVIVSGFQAHQIITKTSPILEPLTFALGSYTDGAEGEDKENITIIISKETAEGGANEMVRVGFTVDVMWF